MLENTLPNKANDPGLDRWLNCESRCFGDKGDVEDITEGESEIHKVCATTGIRLADMIVSQQRTSFPLWNSITRAII